MALKHQWRVEAFSSNHNRNAFSCGAKELDDYIKTLASQDIKRHIARAFVATPLNNFDIMGYYTISAASFRKESLPLKLSRKLPHYPVPSAIIGRLAVDIQWQGKGLGKFLLMDALDRILNASQILAINAVIVDAKDEKARSFYMKYGFLQFPTEPFRLFIPINTIAQMI